ncbi:MAG: DUF4143 domain-containing protein, partial [Candidatus Omnitrophica bacterium]|nr:DUF4143 domain-containing protein [Candidatus Omnitrophota bacterium]
LADAGNTVTLAHYQKLLESAFLIKGLEKWSGGAFRRRSSIPKWLPLNTALVTALANRSFQEWRSSPDAWGRLVEISVGAHLVNEGASHGMDLYYWRQGNSEVDFVLLKGGALVSIEVKSGKRKMNNSGLSLFANRYKPKRSITVGQLGIPLKDFFETPILEWVKI